MGNNKLIKINRYFIPYIIVLMIIGFKEKLIISFIVVFIHEFIHYLTARMLGFKGFDVEILPIGTVLRLKDIEEASPNEDLIIALSAPIINLIAAGIFYLLYNNYSIDIYNLLFQCNFVIGSFNLIPAYPLDGGRILRDLINFKYIYKVANKVTVNISLIIGLLLIFYYLFLFFAGIKSINLGIIALFIILSSLKERERIVYLIMGDIIKKKYKFIKRGYIENKSISIYYKKDLVSVLSIVEKNKYNIFFVLDESMKLMDIIYEEEIIEALKLYGNVTLEELMLSLIHI